MKYAYALSGSAGHRTPEAPLLWLVDARLRLAVLAARSYGAGMTARQHRLVLMYGLTAAEARALTGGPAGPSGREPLTVASHHLHEPDRRELRRAMRWRPREVARMIRAHVAAGVPWQALAEAIR